MTISPTVKKVLLGSLFIAAIIAIGFLLYVVFFQDDDGTNPFFGRGSTNSNTNQQVLPDVNALLANLNISTGSDGGTTGTLPDVDTVANGGLTTTTTLTPDIETQDPAMSVDGEFRFYEPETGKFYSVDENGNLNQIGEAQFGDVEKVTWSNTENETILEFPDGSNIYYDLDSDKQVTLPKEYEEFDFSETSSKIAFKYQHIDVERKVVATSNPDGSGAKTVPGGALGPNSEKVSVQWSPNNSIVATHREFIDGTRQEVGFLGLNNENFKGTIVEGLGFQSQFSPDGRQMLYSVYRADTNYQPELWIVRADGANIGNGRLNLELSTFEDKCAFNDTSSAIYCGVPTEEVVGIALERSIGDTVPDQLYRIDLSSGVKERIAVPVDDNGTPIYHISSIFVNEDETAVIFQDKNSGELVRIDIE